jgi:uncharacterized protein (UPF0335 family)
MSETVAVAHLKQYIDKINRIKSEIALLNDDLKEVFDEAKSHGLDTKIIKQVIKIMNTDKNKLEEQEAILDLYRQALGV